MEKSMPDETLKAQDSDTSSKTSTLKEEVNNHPISDDTADANADSAADKEKDGADVAELRRTSTTESQIVYPTGLKLTLIITALAFAVFLVALVR